MAGFTFEWNPTFAPRMDACFMQAQKFVDSEVLRRTDPYIPKVSGNLIRSGMLGTKIGSGEVRYIAPYAAVQNETAPTRSYDPRRGGQFFERMKIDHRAAILRGAQTLLKG